MGGDGLCGAWEEKKDVPLLIYDGVLIGCVPFCRLRAQDARHHWRRCTSAVFLWLCGPEGQVCQAGFAGDAPRLCSFGYSGILIGMDQNDSYPHGWFCVAMHLALYFLFVRGRPRCSASRPT